MTASLNATKELPFYLPQTDEVEVFEAAYEAQMSVLLTGPTGCGKTRFLEYMAQKLTDRRANNLSLETVVCNDDLTVGDLVGRYVIEGAETVWVEGPLLSTVLNGGICYLDEIVEARKDTMVVIHSLTDHRRLLPVTRLGRTFEAHEGFQLVASYNPGYQATTKNLKQSTRQRFVTIEFGFPPQDAEADIVAAETGIDHRLAMEICSLGSAARDLCDQLGIEGPSTRLLVFAGRLVSSGLPARRACEIAIARGVSDDPETVSSLSELVKAAISRDAC